MRVIAIHLTWSFSSAMCPPTVNAGSCVAGLVPGDVIRSPLDDVATTASSAVKESSRKSVHVPLRSSPCANSSLRSISESAARRGRAPAAIALNRRDG